ncbi:MAG: HEAT repeat domain-containing protein [Planctomycetota bacterium]
MASSLSNSLLASVVALVVAGTVVAQDSKFQEGVKLLRLGTAEDRSKALEAFREVLKEDPSNEQALAYYQSITQDEWFLLLSQQDEIQKIAQSILERAKLERVQRSRDEAAIGDLVQLACAADTGYEDRRNATMKLVANHGEFAVPAIAERLGNPDDADGQVNGIAALVQLGRAAVLPLIELCKSSNSIARLNAAAALLHIGDERAAPAMAMLAQSDDQESVRTVARSFLQKHKINGSAVSLYVKASTGYLGSGVGVGAFSDVVWTLADDKLVARDVPALVYAAELSKASALDGVKADPASKEARSMLAQANLAEANLIETSVAQGDESAKSLEGMVPEFKMAALATGPAILRAALEAGLKNGLPNVSVGAIEALAHVEEPQELGSSSLIKALDSTDKRVRYAAATALVKASNGVSVPATDKVVDALAQAVTEESVRVVQVIGNAEGLAQATREASNQRGLASTIEATAIRGLQNLLVNPGTDVVVIQEILADGLPEDVINNIKKDPRMANTKVVVVAKDVESATARFEPFAGLVTVVAGPLTSETLVGAVNTALEGVAIEPQSVRAEGYAAQASAALLALAEGKASIGLALGSLEKQLDRADAVAVPAAQSLGISGGEAQLAALVEALRGTGSVDLKVAAADSIGQILGRAETCSDEVGRGLAEVLQAGDADIRIRMAAAAALGKAKVDDARRALLMGAMKKIGSPAN